MQEKHDYFRDNTHIEVSTECLRDAGWLQVLSQAEEAMRQTHFMQLGSILKSDNPCCSSWQIFGKGLMRSVTASAIYSVALGVASAQQ